MVGMLMGDKHAIQILRLQPLLPKSFLYSFALDPRIDKDPGLSLADQSTVAGGSAGQSRDLHVS